MKKASRIASGENHYHGDNVHDGLHGRNDGTPRPIMTNAAKPRPERSAALHVRITAYKPHIKPRPRFSVSAKNPSGQTPAAAFPPQIFKTPVKK